MSTLALAIHGTSRRRACGGIVAGHSTLRTTNSTNCQVMPFQKSSATYVGTKESKREFERGGVELRQVGSEEVREQSQSRVLFFLIISALK